jgi:hypothetical protein
MYVAYFNRYNSKSNTSKSVKTFSRKMTLNITTKSRDAVEEFQFKGIPIAAENDGDSEESWERESWDTGEESETEKDSISNN